MSRQWDSELAKLADSLLISQISDRSGTDLSGSGSGFPHPVIAQVSPEKQAMLRNVLVQRPVARIRAVRPETPNESRLLSNLSSMIQSTSIKSPAPASGAQQQASPVSSMISRFDFIAPFRCWSHLLALTLYFGIESISIPIETRKLIACFFSVEFFI